jgi:hypothetical protein
LFLIVVVGIDLRRQQQADGDEKRELGGARSPVNEIAEDSHST